VSTLVDVASMSDGHDNDEEHVVGHGVDDAVVTDADTQPGSSL
jgi:hypothetical protein